MQCLPDSKAFYLNWTVPSGDVEAYELMVERPSSGALQPEIHMSIPGSEASLEGLVPNSSYRISLRVLGRNGMRSWAVTLLCNTSVEGRSPSCMCCLHQVSACHGVGPEPAIQSPFPESRELYAQMRFWDSGLA